MTQQQKLNRYASLILKVGLNLQGGQELVVNAALDAAELVREVARQAYEMGAKEVHINWSDPACVRLNYLCQDQDTLGSVPDWKAEMYNGYARRGCAHLRIVSEDPDAYAGVDATRIALASQAISRATQEAVACRMTGVDPWLVVGYPGKEWARKVFPGLEDQQAMEKLWDAILYVTRALEDDPVAAWQRHEENLRRRMAWLNAQRFVSMHYVSANGTDFTVGLPEKHIWSGGGMALQNGLRFVPNMPTEEIFSVPDRTKAEGTLVAALPLSHNGALIEDFRITFAGGRVVSVEAAKGQDALEGILKTDEGASHLGEIALIPADSPLARLGVLFYNTLYDENASCHFALGRAYPDCYDGGRDMSKQELEQAGANQSLTHVDFMVGTRDLRITGTRPDGSEVVVFENGVWAKDTEA